MNWVLKCWLECRNFSCSICAYQFKLFLFLKFIITRSSINEIDTLNKIVRHIRKSVFKKKILFTTDCWTVTPIAKKRELLKHPTTTLLHFSIRNHCETTTMIVQSSENSVYLLLKHSLCFSLIRASYYHQQMNIYFRSKYFHFATYTNTTKKKIIKPCGCMA